LSGSSAAQAVLPNQSQLIGAPSGSASGRRDQTGQAAQLVDRPLQVDARFEPLVHVLLHPAPQRTGGERLAAVSVEDLRVDDGEAHDRRARVDGRLLDQLDKPAPRQRQQAAAAGGEAEARLARAAHQEPSDLRGHLGIEEHQ